MNAHVLLTRRVARSRERRRQRRHHQSAPIMPNGWPRFSALSGRSSASRCWQPHQIFADSGLRCSTNLGCHDHRRTPMPSRCGNEGPLYRENCTDLSFDAAYRGPFASPRPTMRVAAWRAVSIGPIRGTRVRAVTRPADRFVRRNNPVPLGMDSRSSVPTVVLSLTRVATLRIARFAPPVSRCTIEAMKTNLRRHAGRTDRRGWIRERSRTCNRHLPWRAYRGGTRATVVPVTRYLDIQSALSAAPATARTSVRP